MLICQFNYLDIEINNQLFNGILNLNTLNLNLIVCVLFYEWFQRHWTLVLILNCMYMSNAPYWNEARVPIMKLYGPWRLLRDGRSRLDHRQNVHPVNGALNNISTLQLLLLNIQFFNFVTRFGSYIYYHLIISNKYVFRFDGVYTTYNTIRFQINPLQFLRL